jgi:serine/threonine protein kinase
MPPVLFTVQHILEILPKFILLYLPWVTEYYFVRFIIMGCGDSRSLKPEAAVSSLTKVVLTPEAEPLDISQSVQNRTVKSFQEHYKLVSLLGLGNFSKVFKACHLQSGQQRAVKIIEMPQLRACDSHRAWKEIGVLRSLDHAHIIKGYESFTDRGRYYSVLELCEGGQLVKKMLTVELSPTN